jgi:N,N'-diacetyllegionaminate synthase
MKIKIENKIISQTSDPYIIAEAGINHQGSLSKALKMIDVAKSCGADAIKFQTFNADEFISDKKITYTYFSKGKKIRESMHAMFKRHELKKDDWRVIKNRCRKKKITFLSTAQNYSDLKMLLKLNMQAIKVGSDDFTNIPLIQKYSKHKLPLILSCGMSNMLEIKRTLKIFQKNKIILMLCTSQYPAPAKDLNLQRLKVLQKEFKNLILGYSDHSLGNDAAIIAAALGARCFEKHFTLSHDSEGPDHHFSADPIELKSWCKSIKNAIKIIGDGIVKPSNEELKMLKLARRSAVASFDIKKGNKINEKNVTFKRPGNGISPFNFYKIKNKTVKKNIFKNSLIRLSDLR